ncbi:MAG: hypothetical protein EMLJLAPB_00781 [Candidatus Argoarchaeum ethanivorans]|uniref:Uncharacterized protein n=1 Tax=Candidatus Argoarchaeum ethanivorans TaxID=2608793 RepID=A0A811TIX9_9EURY|nr:MAG: hypothetical protein EMLJLAPB_00781 [Candidatus Argoarchaeum ethanivorans]
MMNMGIAIITEFSTVQEMLDQLIAPKVEELRDSLISEDGTLKMTTNWLVNNGEELIFSHEMLGIPFKNMQVIVNTLFFKPSVLKPYPNAYHEISKNAKWESIDTIVKRREEVLVNPITFISLISCFKGKDNDRLINLSNILEQLTYSNTEKRFIVTLSSEEDVQKKESEIEVAKTTIIYLNGDAEIGDFRISEEGGGYHGFWAIL